MQTYSYIRNLDINADYEKISPGLCRVMGHSCGKNRMLNEVREKWRKYNKIFTTM